MKTILFVCTGNTCRSPMAECLFNHLCKEKGAPLRAISAGVYATGCEPASDGALAAMKARGLSLAAHRTQPVSEALLKDVSLIVAMSLLHVNLLKERYPSLTIPIRSCSPPIRDPFGGSLSTYQQTAAAIDQQITALFRELSEGADDESCKSKSTHI